MRRMWMLLLVVALMVIVLAVPAMAVEKVGDEWPTITSCECAKAGRDENGNPICVVNCPGTPVEWKPWTTANKLPDQAGNWYLTANVNMATSKQSQDQIFKAEGVTIRLDLNGFTVTPYNRQFRFTKANCTLILTDSRGGGALKSAKPYTQGGILWWSAANVSVIMYGGKLDGTEYTSAGTGQNHGSIVEMQIAGASFTLNGGEIWGCTLTEDNLPSNGYYPVSGPIYIGSANTISFTMNGGEIHGSKTRGMHNSNDTTKAFLGARGAAIYVNSNASNTTVTLNGGTIYGGSALSGTKTANGTTSEDKGLAGAIYMGDGLLILDGGTVTGGYATGNGGNISIQPNAEFQMLSGTVTRGTSEKDQGGNVACFGPMTLSGGTISYGQSKNHGGNVQVNSGYTVNINGVTIEKGSAASLQGSNLVYNVNQTKDVSYTINNKTVIKDPIKGSNVFVCTNTYGDKVSAITLNVEDCTISGANTGIALSCSNLDGAEKQPAITLNVKGDCIIGGYPAKSGNGMERISINFNNCVAHVNNYYGVYSSLATATANIAETSYVTLLSDLSNQTVAKSCYLDLNGKTLTGLTVTDDAKISLFDNSGSDYSVPEGSVTLAAVDAADIFNREMTTGTLNIGKNHRYVTILADGKVTAHRIYLGVKATTLHPKTADEKVALGYRIALRCDDVLATYISGYGLQVGTTEDNTVTVNLVTDEKKVSGDGATNDNAKVVGVMFGTNTTLGETEFTGNAYLTLNNGLGNDNAVVSGGATTSLKTLVEAAFDKYNSFTKTMQDNLDWMVGNFDVMSDWDTTPPVSAEGYAALNNKKILFIGNSYTYWGNCVTRPESLKNQSERFGDQGYFYQLCKANGINVDVTNWTYGGHSLSDTMCYDAEGKCDAYNASCKGQDHSVGVKGEYFDYVSIQLYYEPTFDGSQSLVDYLSKTMDMFRSVNPNVKFLFLVPRDAYTGRLVDKENSPRYRWVEEISTLVDEGVMVCNWGDMIYDIEQGRVSVTGATMDYTTTTFVTTKDNHHQNMLVGYLTALMAYSAITGDSAEGQPYYFCGDSTIDARFDMAAYKATYYPDNAETNFIEVMNSEADMNALQRLLDFYLANPVDNN